MGGDSNTHPKIWNSGKALAPSSWSYNLTSFNLVSRFDKLLVLNSFWIMSNKKDTLNNGRFGINYSISKVDKFYVLENLKQ
jgi:hypothetical protein